MVISNVEEKFEILSVHGEIVRIKVGVISMDCRVEIRSDGSYYLEKPPKVFIYPEYIGGMVAAALKAYHKSHSDRINSV